MSSTKPWIINLGFSSHSFISCFLFYRILESKLFHTVVKLSDGSIFVFGGRESPLRPCLDYGIFKVDEKYREHCTAERFDETKPNNEVSIFSWKGELSPISPHEQERKEPSPRWRHSATRIFLKGNIFAILHF